MPYECISYELVEHLEKQLNELAKQYPSFRVISVFVANAIWVLAWFNKEDYEVWLKR